MFLTRNLDWYQCELCYSSGIASEFPYKGDLHLHLQRRHQSSLAEYERSFEHLCEFSKHDDGNDFEMFEAEEPEEPEEPEQPEQPEQPPPETATRKRKRVDIPNNFLDIPESKKRKVFESFVNKSGLDDADFDVKLEILQLFAEQMELPSPNVVIVEKLKKELDQFKEMESELRKKLIVQERLIFQMSSKIQSFMEAEEMMKGSLEFYDQLSRNVVDIISKLPHNSPLRRSLVANLVQNVYDKRRFRLEILERAGLNPKYLYSVKIDDLESMFDIQYSVDPQEKKYWTQEEFQAFDEILDEILPYVSGRDWRMREWTWEDTWREYYTVFSDRYPCLRPMGYTTWKKYIDLKKEKIHFVRQMKNCPICVAMDLQEKGEPLTPHQLDLLRDNPNHRQDIKDAYNYYKGLKEQILATRDIESIVVVEDYSQYHFLGAFYQSLITATYRYNSGASRNVLDCQFSHILRYNLEGNETNKNDKWFTYSVWVYFMEHRVFGDVKKIFLVSDGCSKHFKSAEVHLFWFCLIKRYGIIIEYVYLKSNHSNNPADTGASQGKNCLKYYLISHKTGQGDEFTISGILDTKKNHKSDVIPVYFEVNGVTVRPLDQMRKNHRFVYNIEEKTVTTYARGFDERDGIGPKQVFKYNDTEIQEMEQIIDKIVDHQKTAGQEYFEDEC